jgi:hypothetical protein
LLCIKTLSNHQEFIRIKLVKYFDEPGSAINTIEEYDNIIQNNTERNIEDSRIEISESDVDDILNSVIYSPQKKKKSDDDDGTLEDNTFSGIEKQIEEDVQEAVVHSAKNSDDEDDEDEQIIIDGFCHPSCLKILTTDDSKYGKKNQRLHGKKCKTCKKIMTCAHIKEVKNINYCQLIKKGSEEGGCTNVECGVCEQKRNNGDSRGRRSNRRNTKTRIVGV